MSNWLTNYVTVSGEKEYVRKFFDAFDALDEKDFEEWGILGITVKEPDLIIFDTPNNPPSGWLKKISEKYKIKVENSYSLEPYSYPVIGGEQVYRNGKVLKDVVYITKKKKFYNKVKEKILKGYYDLLEELELRLKVS